MTGRSVMYYSCENRETEERRVHSCATEGISKQAHRDRLRLLKNHFYKQAGSQFLGSIFLVYD